MTSLQNYIKQYPNINPYQHKGIRAILFLCVSIMICTFFIAVTNHHTTISNRVAIVLFLATLVTYLFVYVISLSVLLIKHKKQLPKGTAGEVGITLFGEIISSLFSSLGQ